MLVIQLLNDYRRYILSGVHGYIGAFPGSGCFGDIFLRKFLNFHIVIFISFIENPLKSAINSAPL